MDIKIMNSIKNMVDRFGLEKTWELINEMYESDYKFQLKVLYKSIYKIGAKWK